MESLTGSIRREYWGHPIVFNESGPRRTLKTHFDYYHGVRRNNIETGVPIALDAK